MYSLQNASIIFLVMSVIQPIYAQNQCPKKTIKTQGYSYTSTEYKKTESVQTIISGIYKITWNGKALNVFRCTDKEFPPYIYNEKKCVLRNDVDFSRKTAVLKNLSHDPILMVDAKTLDNNLTLTIHTLIEDESGENKKTVVKLDGEVAKFDGKICKSESELSGTSNSSVTPRGSNTGR